MKEGKIKSDEFWDARYGTNVIKSEIVSRPCLIVKGYLKRARKKLKCSPYQARERFSAKTKIPLEDVLRIEDGQVPTSQQLHMIAEAFNWSMFFVFGIDRGSYQETEQMFFLETGNTTPTMAERKAFKELYHQCLLQKLEDDREVI